MLAKLVESFKFLGPIALIAGALLCFHQGLAFKRAASATGSGDITVAVKRRTLVLFLLGAVGAVLGIYGLISK
jgi:hypothetical protein